MPFCRNHLFAQFEQHNSEIVHAACGGSVRLTVLHFVWQKWQKAAVQCARVCSLLDHFDSRCKPLFRISKSFCSLV